MKRSNKERGHCFWKSTLLHYSPMFCDATVLCDATVHCDTRLHSVASLYCILSFTVRGRAKTVCRYRREQNTERHTWDVGAEVGMEISSRETKMTLIADDQRMDTRSAKVGKVYLEIRKIGPKWSMKVEGMTKVHEHAGNQRHSVRCEW